MTTYPYKPDQGLHCTGNICEISHVLSIILDNIIYINENWRKYSLLSTLKASLSICSMVYRLSTGHQNNMGAIIHGTR